MTEQLSINLSSDISYVSGTVNGEVAQFSLTSPGIWSAVVSRAEDGKYLIDITAYNNLGTTTHYYATIYKLDGAIPTKTDWTSSDYYNAEDLNRVENNTVEVAQLIRKLLGLSIELEPIVFNRDYKSIEFAESLNRIERNIEKLSVIDLQGLVNMKTHWQATDPFSYVDANRLENNLALLFPILDKNIKNVVYSGEFYCGEEVI